MAEWEAIPPGTLFRGRYEVERFLGRGGFGATYRVRDRERFDEVCALKELLPAQAENPKVRELFEREARILLTLRHPGIPSLHAYFVSAGRYYLVQDFVPGRTLAEELKEKGKFTEGEVLQVIEGTLGILEYLHSRKPAVIHRDVKPANAMRSDQGGIYLIDFGAIKEAVGQTTLSAESTIIGTSGYTPPEQLRGIVMPASDLYSVGALVLHLVSGRSPAEWYDAFQGTWRFSGRLGLTPRLDAALMRLLEEQPAKRFQSVAELRAFLGAPVAADKMAHDDAARADRETGRGVSLPPGKVLRDRYEIVALRARRRMSASYRGVDRERFDAPCLVEEFVARKEAGAGSPSVYETFQNEARRLAALVHTSIPRALAFFAEDGRYYLVWEHTEGETLAEAVRARGQFGEGQAVAILKQVLDALAYLHEQSPPVIHGAIRPSNLVMTSSGTVVLTGFGSVQEAVTNAPILNMGSEESDYVAPEQQRGETSPSSDLYALAATTVFLLTGRKLGTNPQSEVSHAAGDGPRSSPVSHVVSELTTLQPSVRQALTKMLEVSVTTRVARADEVLADLGAVRVPEPIVVDRSRTVSIPALDMTRAEPSRHRENDATTGQVSRRGTWSLVSVGVVAIIALVIWASSLVRSPDQRPAGGVSTPPAAPVPPQSPPTTGITPPAVAPPVTPEAPSPPRPKPKVASRPRSPSAPAGETPQVAPPTSTTSPAAPVVEGPKPPAEPKGGESPALHDETSRLFLAPFDRVWTTTESALKNLGWDIDKRERTQGYILTESRSLDKDNFGVWEKSLRHRLRLQLKASGSNQTLVTVERTIFKRQRVMWVNTDTPVESDSRLGHKAEQAVLAEIARAL